MGQRRRLSGISKVANGADFSDAEREFMVAMDRFKRTNHRPYPTCRDVLRVLKSLGYEKRVAPPVAEGR
jgi:hypothetical protein